MNTVPTQRIPNLEQQMGQYINNPTPKSETRESGYTTIDNATHCTSDTFLM